MESMRSQKGFTLAELLIVVAIILVLVAIAIPVFTGATQKAEEATCAANRTSLARMLTTQYQLTGKFDQVAAELLAKEQGFVCPNKDGSFTIAAPTAQAAARVTCSVHSNDSLPETVMKDFNAFKKEWLSLPENAQKNRDNDSIRKAYFKQFTEAKPPKTFPTLRVGGKELIIQPYYKSGAEEGGNVWLFAKGDTDNKWNTRYVYDPIDKKWYEATTGNGGSGGSTSINAYKDAAALHKDITEGKRSNGKPKWIPLEKYEEIPSHDITNP
ncbi:MAG: prepilin-type N-terminal cleavage/methylation domain-containing protein [Raoultibacter sp.]